MKGTITRCLAELVSDKFGADQWTTILADAGLSDQAESLTSLSADIEDAAIGKLLGSTCKVLGISLPQAADAFGEYWCCTYAPRLYPAIVDRFKTAKEMVLGMDQVHGELTRSVPGANPPRIVYEWQDDRTLRTTYQSNRGMLDIFIGLVKGAGVYFNEDIKVAKIGANMAEIVFSA